jgi:hypothetical protein
MFTDELPNRRGFERRRSPFELSQQAMNGSEIAHRRPSRARNNGDMLSAAMVFSVSVWLPGRQQASYHAVL